MNRIRGLDSIRFICALCVVVGHLGVPPFLGLGHGIPHLARVAFRGLINEQAAVIVFFLISGLCIHFPYRNGKNVDLKSFYTRRLIRISLPFLIIIPLGALVGVHYTALRTGIFWSLIAEIIYYLLYPALLGLSRRFGWQKMIGVSLVAACAVILTHRHASNFQDLGDVWTWLIGLPCWMLGCLIAQNGDALTQRPARNIWLSRAGIVAVAGVATVLRWHTPHLSIGFPISLNLFAIAAYFWLVQEVAHFRHHEPPRLLEWAGAWSYSLYLIHIPAANAAKLLFPAVAKNLLVSNYLNIAGALLCAYAFYWLVERPAHLLALRLAAEFKSEPRIAAPAAS